MRRFLKASALAVAGLLVAIPALADLGPPVSIRLLGKPRAAEFGVPFEGQVEIVPEVATELSDFHFEESPGWTTMSLTAPNATRMDKAQSLVVDFAVLPSNPAEWLTLTFMMDGHPVSKSFDLSAANLKRVTTPGALVPAKDAPDPRGELGGKELQSPEPVHLEGAHWAEKGGSPDKSRSIRVYGRFVYQRSDGVTLGADGVTVRVYDEDSTWDELLAELVTDAYGYYDVTFTWDPCFVCDSEPDIYVHFETTNSKATTENATWPTYDNYSWETGTHDDYTGSSLNFGTLQPSAEGDHPALHIQTDLTRTWRWLLNHEGYNVTHVSAQWPDGASGAYYNGDTIHVGVDRQWREDTHSHEYGHHWVGHYATQVSPDYCNGTCDTPTCGHCIWCAETDHDALSEGWPNWLCDVITRSYAGDYGTASLNTRSQENLNTCSAGVYDNPLTTEGFLGALCRDIEDSGQDSHGVYGSWTDRLALGTNEIFDVMDFDQPTTPSGFLTAFKARYPSTVENLWETAKNCGYEIDVANPSAPTGLTSSHAVGGDSPDPTVQFNWTRAADDASGVSGYGITIAGSAGLPSAVKDINDVTTYTTAALAPGTYYFSIRTIDRAGRWGSGYAWYGPFTIRAPEPANLTYTTVAGWDGPLVPRSTADATGASATASATLPGNTASSYWNVRGVNNGESSTSVGFQSRLYVDDVYVWWAGWGSIGAGGGFYGNNLGPVNVRGGRHTYEVRYDALDAISETSETDNDWGHQWIWTPYALTANTPATRSAPPASTAGWGSVVDGSTLWYICDGVRFNSSGWWNAAVLRPLSSSYDYDLRMHAASTGATSGFAANIGWSANGAGATDAVFSNRNVVGALDYDVGVLNHGGDTGNYEITHVTSQPFAFGDSLTVPYAANQELRLWEFYVAATDTGNVSITVDCDPAVGQFNAMWLGKTFTTGDLNDGTRSTTDATTGRARLDIAIHQAGYNCLVVWRDPYGTGSAGTGATNVTIEIQGTPPDFVTYQAAGWHSPIVPRPLNDGTGASVALPDSLRGNIASTYLNLAVRNNSPTTASGLPGQIHLDGVYTWWLSWGTFPGYANSLFNWGTPWTVRGGRHTLALWLDQDNAYEEMWENNNRFGEQYVWSPYILAPNTPVARSLPPDLTGGWEDVQTGEALWYNCDGLRMPNTGGWWRAVAVMPGASSNVDVRLHPVGTGTKTPFGSNLAYSGWGPGLSDYVLVNFNVTPWAAYDAGVLRQSTVSQNYTAETTSSSILSSNPTGGTFGPFTLAANRMLGLHEVYLSAGVHVIRLHNTAGTVDWGLTLHPSTTAVQTKSTAVANGSAWFAGAGQDEYVLVDLATAGWYCVAVWKRGAADLPLSGSYQLTFPASSGVPGGDVPPAATALVGIHPNPFNPETRVTFDLVGAQQVSLAVYDLKGHLVRTLVDESRPAGRHEAVWNGRDDGGRQVASGVYMARLVAGGVSQMQKMIMVK